MMFINVKEPDATLSMLPWFVPADKSRIEIGYELSERLDAEPENTLVIVMADQGSVQGVVAAYIETNPDNGERHVFIWQAQTLPVFQYAKLVFDQITLWAKDKNINRIVIGTQRGRALCRKYGFQKLTGDYFVKEI